MNPNDPNAPQIYGANNCMLMTNAIPLNKIDSIKEYMKRFMNAEEGVTASAEPPSEGGTKSDARSCQVAWIQPDTKFTGEFIGAVSNIIISMNRDWYGFDTHVPEPIQYTMYKYDENNKIKDHYDWHMDSWYSTRPQPLERKLSMSIQLSHGDEYTGCDLIFPDSERITDPSMQYGGNLFNGQPVTKGEWDAIAKQKGTAVFFPSSFYHRVTPIESGERYALVNWLQGPKWR